MCIELNATSKNIKINKCTPHQTDKLRQNSHYNQKQSIGNNICVSVEQTLALVEKNVLQKIRSPITTLFELTSPTLIVLLLVFLRNTSQSIHTDESIYASLALSLPGPILTQYLNFITETDDCENVANNCGKSPYLMDSNITTTTTDNKFLNSSSFEKSDFNFTANENENGRRTHRKRSLQALGKFSAEFHGKQGEYNDEESLLSLLSTQFSNLLEGPLLIPSLEQYIQISDTIYKAASFDADKNSNLTKYEKENTRNRQTKKFLDDSEHGWLWNNLLLLGTLHIAPENIAEDLIRFLNVTYGSHDILTFPTRDNNDYEKNEIRDNDNLGGAKRRVVIRVHDNVETALQYMDNNPHERTWAMIDLMPNNSSSCEHPTSFSKQLASDCKNLKDKKFSIRMNKISTPNTNVVTSLFNSGLSDKYKGYYLSGFLTLQRILTEFSFHQYSDAHKRNPVTVEADSSMPLCNLPKSSTIWSMPMPTAESDKNLFYMLVGLVMGAMLALSFFFPISRLLKCIVEEKQSRMRQTLEIMGVKRFSYWASWLCSSLFVFGIITILDSVVFTYDLFKSSDLLCVMSLLATYSTSVIAFSFFISTFFEDAKNASIIGPAIFLLSLLPRFVFADTNENEFIRIKLLGSVLPCTAFAFGVDKLVMYEGSAEGIHWHNANDGDYSYNMALMMLIFDTLFYFILTWIMDASMLPGVESVSNSSFCRFWVSLFRKMSNAIDMLCIRRGQFVLLPNYDHDENEGLQKEKRQRRNSYELKDLNNGKEVLSSQSKFCVDTGLDICDDESYGMVKYPAPPFHVSLLSNIKQIFKVKMLAFKVGYSNHNKNCCDVEMCQSESMEMVKSDVVTIPPSLRCSEPKEVIHDPLIYDMKPKVKIINLVKRYSGSFENAVDDLTFELFEDQITCLLGHNGAGKSSTISMLTGLSPPTSGDCLLYGNSIVRSPALARQSMGICPQQNIIFEDLTVYEHIKLFQRIKGISSSKDTILQSVIDVGLEKKLHTVSKALSGGMKRKLCCAIALVGDPKFVLLDEPTSGMDPHSRRSIWKLLRQKKKGRVILLTTHFMDEAEVLSDRIVIMKSGKVQCSGSSFFLKKRFGLGVYNLTLVMETIEKKNNAGQSKSIKAFPSREMSEFSEEQFPKKSQIEPGIDQVCAITHFIEAYAPKATLVRKEARELKFDFPPGSEDKVLPSLFEALEEKNALGKLGITGYGLSVASLEDVFLNLAEKTFFGSSSDTVKGTAPAKSDSCRQRFSIQKKAASHCHKTLSNDKSSELEFVGFFSQVLILMRKRAVIQGRDNLGTFTMIFFPVILVALILQILSIQFSASQHALKLSVDMHSGSLTGVHNSRTKIPIGVGPSDSIGFEKISSDMQSLFTSNYKFVDVERVKQVTSSLEMSKYLLQTSSSKKNSARYGSFVLNDKVNLQTDVNFDKADLLFETISDLGFTSSWDLGPYSNVHFNTSVQKISELEKNNSTDALQLLFGGAEKISKGAALLNSLVSSIGTENLSNLIKVSNAWINDREGWSSKNMTINISTVKRGTQNRIVFSGITLTISEPFDDGDLLIDLGEITLSSDQTKAILSKLSPKYGKLSTLLKVLAIRPFHNLHYTISFVTLGEFVDEHHLSSEDSGLKAMLRLIDGAYLSKESIVSFQELETLGELTTSWQNQPGGWSDDYIAISAFQIAMIGTQINMINLTLTFTDGVTGDNVYNLGNITFSPKTIEQFSSLLPKGNASYDFERVSSVTILHNSTSPHAVAAYNQAYNEFLFKKCTQDDDAELAIINHPLPLSRKQSAEAKIKLSLVVLIFMFLPFCYIPGAFIVFLVKERSSKSKHVQLVSGVNMLAFWMSTFMWDLLLYAALVCLVMLVFLAYGTDTTEVFVGNYKSFKCTFLLLLGYGFSGIPFAYIISRHFKNFSNAQISVTAVFFLTGFIADNVYLIMKVLGYDMANSIKSFMQLWPGFNLGEGFIQLTTTFWRSEYLGRSHRLDPLAWDAGGESIVYLFLLGIPYFSLLILLEYSQDGGSSGWAGNLLRKLRTSVQRNITSWFVVQFQPKHEPHSLDAFVPDCSSIQGGTKDNKAIANMDVLAERDYVYQCSHNEKESSAVLLKNVWKIYPPTTNFLVYSRNLMKSTLSHIFGASSTSINDSQFSECCPKKAVQGLTTAIAHGETFGLLGANGAGKSTTMGILTGDISLSSGEAYVAGFDITHHSRNGMSEARKRIGFCPQVDPLLDLMTGRETLSMYGRLRGIPSHALDATVNDLIVSLTLTPHADKPAGCYSGGNKRKLSLGIALIGDPQILFIDEASSGMDPLARRKMWHVIANVARHRSVVITSHNMEEVEALCTRVTIMSEGEMKCLGSVQHLKNTHLNGYTFDLQCALEASIEDIETAKRHVLDTRLPTSILLEEHGRFLRFSTPSLTSNSTLSISTVFRALNEMKNDPTFLIQDYAVSQCTLEQVFISFAHSKTNSEST